MKGTLSFKPKFPGREALMAVLVALSILFTPGVSPSAENLVISTVYPDSMTNNEAVPALYYFKALLEERTGGAYDVEIYAGGQLGNEVETTREVQDGVTIQMTLASSGAFSSFYRKYQAVVAPYLFPSRLTAWALFDSDFFAQFMSGLPATGLRYLGTMDDGGGFVVLTNNLRPVRKPDDFEGMRIRTEENPAHMAVMSAMGASTVPMAWGQVATSLATKVAHGQFNALSIVAFAKFWETQKYVTYLNHIYNTITWVVSDKWFKAQKPEYQRQIIMASREAVVYSRGLAAHLSDLAVDACKKHKMKFNHITPKNMARFKKLAQDGYRKWAVEEFGLKASLLDSIQDEVNGLDRMLKKTLPERYGK
jgi:TRAP-type C4-dicarboxylate transport system substrate-binding protein